MFTEQDKWRIEGELARVSLEELYDQTHSLLYKLKILRSEEKFFVRLSFIKEMIKRERIALEPRVKIDSLNWQQVEDIIREMYNQEERYKKEVLICYIDGSNVSFQGKIAA